MEKQEISPKMKRQRKFLLVLPLLVLPFTTMAFWALGGGKTQVADAKQATHKGFNFNLPDANVKDDKPMDKMSYYLQAMQDSTKLREQRQNDPSYKRMDGAAVAGNPFGSGGLNTSLSGNGTPNDPNTANIYRKLELLNKELNKPVAAETGNPYDTGTSRRGGAAVNSADVDRLEKMMHTMSQPQGSDPEMEQLNNMLEKIMDIQHPERVTEKSQQVKQAEQQSAYTVTAGKEQAVSLLDNSNPQTTGNGFYGLDDTITDTTAQNAIPAVVHETQVLVNGSIVKLRLQADITVNGIVIPKDSFIFGTAALSGERLTIEIESLRYGNSIFPVTLQVFDMDGLDGIHIPGAISRDVAAQSADRSVQGIGLTSLAPTWQAQAAGAGIETAKTLFSKKVKLVKVTVKAGYHVLLRDSKQKQATIQINQ